MTKRKRPGLGDAIEIRVYARKSKPGKSYVTVETIADMLHANSEGFGDASVEQLASTLQADIGDPMGVRVLRSDVRRAMQIIHYATGRVVDLATWRKWRRPP
jgi:hypothetical protein